MVTLLSEITLNLCFLMVRDVNERAESVGNQHN